MSFVELLNRSNEEITARPTKSQSISPLAMERQNGFTNGTKESHRVGRHFLDTSQGYSEVDRGSTKWNSDIKNLSHVQGNENNNTKKPALCDTIVLSDTSFDGEFRGILGFRILFFSI